ncbi:hypothetical protein EDC04DRAFT_2609915 [Pisolithus marmoratus]|nr:hypothetical protein EDC04DRAFT_2609915 [Pisolithus marmoratus]
MIGILVPYHSSNSSTHRAKKATPLATELVSKDDHHLTNRHHSVFMSLLLQNAHIHVWVNRGQRPRTTEVHMERCHFDRVQGDVIIIDTPSFHTYMNPDEEGVVKKWMDSNYMRLCKAAGVLYMHKLAFNPNDSHSRVSKHLGAFQCAQLCETSSDQQLFDEKPKTAWDIVQGLLSACKIGIHPRPIQCETSLEKPEVAENDYVVLLSLDGLVWSAQLGQARLG